MIKKKQKYENEMKWNEILPPGVVEYSVPFGVDEQTSGNWAESLISTFFDGIDCDVEHNERAIGEADIFYFLLYF